MTGRRVTRRGRLAVLAALLAVLAGCGVPSESGVSVVGPGLAPGRAAGSDTQPPPPRREIARTPHELVASFLAAAAGDPAGAEQRTREFFPAQEQPGWKPGNKINVVRYRDADLVVTPEGSSYKVDLRVRQVGVLDGDTGAMETPTESRTLYRFRVAPGSDGTLFITGWDPRQQHLLLSTNALSSYYQERNLYFWAGEGLVPDLRYLPLSVDKKERPTYVVKWLLEGASSWLRPAVDEMPDNTALQGNVTSPDDRRLEVDLSAPDAGKDPAKVDRLAAQLRWSLAADLTADLILKIDGQEKKIGTPYHPLVTELPGAPQRFAILAGQVRALSTLGAQTRPDSAVLQAPDNSRVQRAALADADNDYAAALVRQEGGNRLRLWIGSDRPSANRLDHGVSYRVVGDSFHEMSRPQWLPGSATRAGLVLADGRLFRFDRDAGGLSAVDAQPGITAMAVAPDGHRIALLVGGRVLVAPMLGDQLSVGAPRVLPTMLTRLAGVGWSQQDRLVVAGQLPGGQTGFTELTVDGAVEEQRGGEIGNTKVSQLVAYPDNPDGARDVGSVLYEADNRAYQLTGTVVEQISAAEVRPVGKPPTPPPGEQSPTAPFFLDP